jgi:hypothetical protein
MVPKRRSRSQSQASAQRKLSSSTGTPTVAEVQRLFEDGCSGANTNEETWLVTRYIKHHRPRRFPRNHMDTPDAEDWRAFKSWISGHPKRGNRTERAIQDSRFEGRWLTAAPLKSATNIPSLTTNDVRHIAATVARIADEWQDTRRRSGLVIVMAYAFGIARADHPGHHGSVETPIPIVRLQQAWRDEYRPYIDRLIRAEVIERVSEAGATADGRPTLAIYRLELPEPGGATMALGGPPDLGALIAASLTNEELRATFPAKRGKPWSEAFGRATAGSGKLLRTTDRGHLELR